LVANRNSSTKLAGGRLMIWLPSEWGEGSQRTWWGRAGAGEAG